MKLQRELWINSWLNAEHPWKWHIMGSCNSDRFLTTKESCHYASYWTLWGEGSSSFPALGKIVEMSNRLIEIPLRGWPINRDNKFDEPRIVGGIQIYVIVMLAFRRNTEVDIAFVEHRRGVTWVQAHAARVPGSRLTYYPLENFSTRGTNLHSLNLFLSRLWKYIVHLTTSIFEMISV